MQQTVQIPSDAGQLAALRQRRDELDSQLRGLTDRRQQLVSERASASSFSGNQALVGELDVQIRELSTRLRRLDAEKFAMDDAISTALKQGVSDQGQSLLPPQPPPPLPTEVITLPGFGGFDPAAIQQKYERLMFVEGLGFLLLGFVLWRWGVRRGRREGVGSGQADTQLRQAVDSIAIEVERISENQRYVTKLLAEQNQAAGVSRPQSEAERVSRDAR
jgi:hypothetical protein